MRNKSYTLLKWRKQTNPDFDPRLESQTCSKCSRVAEYIYGGDPRCSEHLPDEAKEAATEVR